MESISLKSILSHASICMHSSQTVDGALEVMDLNSISSVVIVDDESHPVGIFTEYDALRIIAEKTDTQKTLSEEMTPDPLCVAETLNIHDAYTIMENKGYRHLVVVDADKKFVGIVSEGDFIRHISFKELNKFSRISDIISSSPQVINKSTTIAET
ncbi:MAG: CBS domain-containing protein, partial [Sulfurimonas sp.]|nr:CBS domain-containing protein [Sulfurimonas sp.]